MGVGDTFPGIPVVLSNTIKKWSHMIARRENEICPGL